MGHPWRVTFTGIILVFGQILISFGVVWYAKKVVWYLILLIIFARIFDFAPACVQVGDQADEVCSYYTIQSFSS